MCVQNAPVWTLAHLALKFPAAAVLAGMTYAGLTYYEDQKPIVVVTFDDGWKSVRDNALPIMKEHDVVGTNYLNTDSFGFGDYISVNDVQSFVEAGWEIGSHGVHHDDMTTLSEFDLAYSLKSSKNVLSILSGKEVTSFASPYGSYNEQTLSVIGEFYDSHVNAINGWSQENGLNTMQNFDPMLLNRIDITEEVSANTVCERFERLNNNEMYVILFHKVTDEPGKYNTKVETFQNIIECLTNSDVRVMTISDAIEEMSSK